MDEEVKALQQALGDLPERLAEVLRTGAEQADLDGPQRPGFPEGDEPEQRKPGAVEAGSAGTDFEQRPGVTDSDEAEFAPRVTDSATESSFERVPLATDSATESSFERESPLASVEDDENSFEQRSSPLADTEDESESPRESPFATAAAEADSSGVEGKLDELKTLLTEIRDKLRETDGGGSEATTGGPALDRTEMPVTKPFSPIFNGIPVDEYHDESPRVNVRVK